MLGIRLQALCPPGQGQLPAPPVPERPRTWLGESVWSALIAPLPASPRALAMFSPHP